MPWARGGVSGVEYGVFDDAEFTSRGIFIWGGSCSLLEVEIAKTRTTGRWELRDPCWNRLEEAIIMVYDTVGNAPGGKVHWGK